MDDLVLLIVYLAILVVILSVGAYFADSVIDRIIREHVRRDMELARAMLDQRIRAELASLPSFLRKQAD